MLAAVLFTASERLATAVGEWFATRSAHADREDVGDRLLATMMIINELELGFARDAYLVCALSPAGEGATRRLPRTTRASEGLPGPSGHRKASRHSPIDSGLQPKGFDALSAMLSGQS